MPPGGSGERKVRLIFEVSNTGETSIKNADKLVEGLEKRLKTLTDTLEQTNKLLGRFGQETERTKKPLEDAESGLVKLAKQFLIVGGAIGGAIFAINRLVSFLAQPFVKTFETARTVVDTLYTGIKTFTDQIRKATEANERFRISLEGALKSPARARELTSFLNEFALRSPQQIQDIQELVKSLALIPAVRPAFFGDFEQVKVRLEDLFNTIIGLASLNPQQGIPGAVFAVREALTGQFRTLRARFDVMPEIIAGAIGKTLAEIKKSPALIIQALKAFTDEVVGAETVGRLGELPSVKIENIIEQLTQIGPQQVGRAGFQQFLSSLLTSLDNAMQPFFAQGGDFERSFAPRISSALQRIIASFSDIIRTISSQFFGAQGLPADANITNLVTVLTEALEGIADFAVQLAVQVRKNAPQIQDTLSGIISGFKTFIGTIFNFILDLPRLLPVVKLVGQGFFAFQTIIAEVARNIISIMNRLTDLFDRFRLSTAASALGIGPTPEERLGIAQRQFEGDPRNLANIQELIGLRGASLVGSTEGDLNATLRANRLQADLGAAFKRALSDAGLLGTGTAADAATSAALKDFAKRVQSGGTLDKALEVLESSFKNLNVQGSELSKIFEGLRGNIVPGTPTGTDAEVLGLARRGVRPADVLFGLQTFEPAGLPPLDQLIIDLGNSKDLIQAAKTEFSSFSATINAAALEVQPKLEKLLLTPFERAQKEINRTQEDFEKAINSIEDNVVNRLQVLTDSGLGILRGDVRSQFDALGLPPEAFEAFAEQIDLLASPDAQRFLQVLDRVKEAGRDAADDARRIATEARDKLFIPQLIEQVQALSKVDPNNLEKMESAFESIGNILRSLATIPEQGRILPEELVKSLGALNVGLLRTDTTRVGAARQLGGGPTAQIQTQREIVNVLREQGQIEQLILSNLSEVEEVRNTELKILKDIRDVREKAIFQEESRLILLESESRLQDTLREISRDLSRAQDPAERLQAFVRQYELVRREADTVKDIINTTPVLGADDPLAKVTEDRREQLLSFWEKLTRQAEDFKEQILLAVDASDALNQFIKNLGPFVGGVVGGQIGSFIDPEKVKEANRTLKQGGQVPLVDLLKDSETVFQESGANAALRFVDGFQGGLGDSLFAAFTGNFEGITNAWAGLLENLQRLVADFIAEVVVRFAVLSFLKNILGGGVASGPELSGGGAQFGTISASGIAAAAGFAFGGIVGPGAGGPVLALMGEGSRREAVVPLTAHDQIPATITSQGIAAVLPGNRFVPLTFQGYQHGGIIGGHPTTTAPTSFGPNASPPVYVVNVLDPADITAAGLPANATVITNYVAGDLRNRGVTHRAARRHL